MTVNVNNIIKQNKVKFKRK